ncbi:MAG TPA: right-handed parallel beta-helix repeat-containing protein [Hanamia sp.]|nr:right-handed parallel beta-helix repeat-containing protein [Hanamia sp.]
MIRSYLFIFLLFSFCNKRSLLNQDTNKKHNYFFSVNGNDKNNGSFLHPFKTIELFNSLKLNPGDSIFFKGGEIFKGNVILDSTKTGVSKKPVVITSYGNGNAIINAGNGTAFYIYNLSYLKINNFYCKGSGRKKGNTKSGIEITNCHHISINNIEVSGFQKSGLQIYSCKNVTIHKVYAHDNGAAGIGVDGDYKSKLSTKNIYITYCKADNNAGDPTNLTNQSGNGIVVGHCTDVVIDHCSATNNGWDMPRIGNGPVGIWCYEADSVIIQHCISYRNKTSVGGADGGGFDLDGGVTNSVIQYCLSYENQGSGYCIFQYWGASPWYNNVIRFNISENDGLVSDSRAGLYIWNSSKDAEQFSNCDVYNNTIYNSKEAALSFSQTSQRKNFRFFNNIFIGKDNLIRGNEGDDIFLANDWYSIEKKFNANGISDFKTWTIRYNKEQMNQKIIGLNIIPTFKNPSNTTFTDVKNLTDFNNYKINGFSPVTKYGIDLQYLFGISVGTNDFNGEPVNKNFIGACTHQ